VLQRLRAARKNESGFTLIELLIVIVILGVLAGVVVFAVNGISDRGVTAACKADKNTVEVATEAYYAKFNSFPGPADAVAGAPTPAESLVHLTTLKTTGFLKTLPSNTQYSILLASTGAVTVTGGSGGNCP